MAKGAPNHLDFHLDTTWDYISGSGYANPIYYRPLNYEGLPHDLLHVFYYAGVYIGGPILILIVIGFAVSAIEEMNR